MWCATRAANRSASTIVEAVMPWTAIACCGPSPKVSTGRPFGEFMVGSVARPRPAEPPVHQGSIRAHDGTGGDGRYPGKRRSGHPGGMSAHTHEITTPAPPQLHEVSD